MTGLRQALGLLTVVGGPGGATPAAVPWFPVVGALLGGALGVLWWAAGEVWPAAVAAVVVVAADLALTGMLHVDGLADSADGLLPHLDRARRLDAMRAPDVGAFGAATVATALLARWAALAVSLPDVALLASVWAASRAAMGTIAAVLPYARATGLASPFLGARTRGPLAVGAVVAVPPALLAGWRGVAALAGVAAGAAVVAALAHRRVGGFTGDVLGAAGVVAETAALVLAAARW